MRRGRGPLPLLVRGALLAVVAAIALWPGAERAEAACEADVCLSMEFQTNQEGVYYLVITPFMTEALLPEPLRDCVWEVEATYSDGSPPEHHVFDAASSFSASHQFAERGEHAVVVLATNGVQADNGEPCPSIQIDARVIFPEPPPPPPPPPPEGEPPDPPVEGPGSQPPSQPSGAVPAPPAPVPTSSTASGRWLRCGGILTRDVACARAAAVARAARSLLSRMGSRPRGRAFRVRGFDCRVRRGAGRPLRCSRAGRLILAPLARGRLP